MLIDLVYSTPGLEELINLAPGNAGKESIGEIYSLVM